MKRLFLILLTFVGVAQFSILNFQFSIGVAVFAQNEGYYTSVQGLKKAELKTALHDIIQPNMVLRYGGKGEGYTWDGFYQTDWLDGGYVRDRYSNEQRQFNDDRTAVSNMNIEHIWANSWWGHLVNNAYCDLFNLYPADAPANGRKSNNPIGVVDGAVAFNNGVTKVGKSTSYRADSLITCWEPADEWKGDFARTYFYMATCYQHMQDLWTTTEGWLTVDGSLWPTMRPWVYQLMLQWADQDPVDDIERQRNEVIFGIQGNRNPFVDYPQLCQYVWGDSTEYRFYIDPKSTRTELFVPINGAGYDFGLQALSKGYHTTIALRGRNLRGNLTLGVDNPQFLLGTTTVSAQQMEEGFDLPITLSPSAAGTYETTLTLTGDGINQQNHLTVTFVDGIPAYEATDIVCSVNSRRFTANWMDYQEGANYTLEVYTKDEAGKAVAFNTYTTTETSQQVTGVQPKTTYYYTVSIYDGNNQLVASSNEVKVEMPEVTPVFSVSPSEVSLSAVPGQPSAAVKLSVSAFALPDYDISVVVNEPFELSTDGEHWLSRLALRGTSPTFFVRLTALQAEGEYEGEMVVSAPGVEERIVTLTASVDAQKAFFEDFETGSKGGYAAGNVACSAADWEMSNALIAADDNAIGSKCVRMKGYVKSGGTITTPAYIMMTTDKVNGCDSLWFYAGSYGNDKGVKMTVSYSLDAGQTWTPVVSTLAVGTMSRYGYKINKEGNIRLKFASDNTGNVRVNIDDVQMSSCKSTDGIREIDNSQCTIHNAQMSIDKGYDLSGHRATNGRRIVVRSGKKVLKLKP